MFDNVQVCMYVVVAIYRPGKERCSNRDLRRKSTGSRYKSSLSLRMGVEEERLNTYRPGRTGDHYFRNLGG